MTFVKPALLLTQTLRSRKSGYGDYRWAEALAAVLRNCVCVKGQGLVSTIRRLEGSGSGNSERTLAKRSHFFAFGSPFSNRHAANPMDLVMRNLDRGRHPIESIPEWNQELQEKILVASSQRQHFAITDFGPSSLPNRGVSDHDRRPVTGRSLGLEGERWILLSIMKIGRLGSSR